VTLAGDPWTAGRVTPAEDLGPATAATAAADLAVAAYVSAAGLRIVEICAEYAATRRQFGRAIGDYQAVSQPLAEAYSRLAGIRDVLDGPFDDVDLAGPGTGERAARVRLIAVGAATHASYVGFQTQGGMGFVDGTELAHLGKRIRQIALAGEPRAAGIERAVGRLIA
ncbi:MAG: hypothetical protein QOH14_4079, partial [Pseudonocardiales bacterium]|nr:hypothetical protein [Pseudonocardiales bacterium]